MDWGQTAVLGADGQQQPKSLTKSALAEFLPVRRMGIPASTTILCEHIVVKKSVVVLDETKQLQCGYVTVGCRRYDGGRSHPPQCTTSRKDRQIGRIAVTGRSV
ncbi:hypothetical protein TNCV_4420561 [Trichonephila clavipes]|nr:hypothetical protein TNCV_4420561 [Trichonephila clavipes]